MDRILQNGLQNGVEGLQKIGPKRIKGSPCRRHCCVARADCRHHRLRRRGEQAGRTDSRGEQSQQGARLSPGPRLRQARLLHERADDQRDVQHSIHHQLRRFAVRQGRPDGRRRAIRSDHPIPGRLLGAEPGTPQARCGTSFTPSRTPSSHSLACISRGWSTARSMRAERRVFVQTRGLWQDRREYPRHVGIALLPGHLAALRAALALDSASTPGPSERSCSSSCSGWFRPCRPGRFTRPRPASAPRPWVPKATSSMTSRSRLAATRFTS